MEKTYNTHQRISSFEFHHVWFKNSINKRDPEQKILLLNLSVIRFPSHEIGAPTNFVWSHFPWEVGLSCYVNIQSVVHIAKKLRNF